MNSKKDSIYLPDVKKVDDFEELENLNKLSVKTFELNEGKTLFQLYSTASIRKKFYIKEQKKHMSKQKDILEANRLYNQKENIEELLKGTYKHIHYADNHISNFKDGFKQNSMA